MVTPGNLVLARLTPAGPRLHHMQSFARSHAEALATLRPNAHQPCTGWQGSRPQHRLRFVSHNQNIVCFDGRPPSCLQPLQIRKSISRKLKGHGPSNMPLQISETIGKIAW